MPDKMTIRINADSENQTVSKFAINEGGRITFHNDAGAAATVTFSGTSPLCPGTAPVSSFPLAAGASKSFKVCSNIGGQQFKYTATVAGAAPEDPILVVERPLIVEPPQPDPIVYPEPIVFPEGYVILAIAVAAGVFVGYYVARRRFMAGR